MVYPEHLPSFWQSGIAVHARQRFCCHNSLLGELCVSRVTFLGTGPLKVCGFLQAFPQMAFPFIDFTLHLFSEMNHSHEHDCMQSPMSPPRESLNLRVVLGNVATQR